MTLTLDPPCTVPPEPTDDATRRAFLAGAAGVLATGLAGCGSDGGGDGDATRMLGTARGPVRVPGNPRRTVVLDAGLAGHVYALGAPVAATYTKVLGVDNTAAGFPPLWSERAERDRTRPLEGTEIQIERIAATRPDLILGGGQGFFAAQADRLYGRLGRIAPTVLMSAKLARWQDQLAFVARVLGREDRARELVTRYERRAAEVRRAIRLPEQPTAVLLSTDRSDRPFVVPPTAALPTLLADAGFRLDDVLRKAGNPKLFGTGDGFVISKERLGEVLDAPSLIVVPTAGPSAAELARDPLYARLPAFRADRVFELPGFSYRPDFFGAMATLDRLERRFR